jgi:hypothetical protein
VAQDFYDILHSSQHLCKTTLAASFIFIMHFSTTKETNHEPRQKYMQEEDQNIAKLKKQLRCKKRRHCHSVIGETANQSYQTKRTKRIPRRHDDRVGHDLRFSKQNYSQAKKQTETSK